MSGYKASDTSADLEVLDDIQQRVLWLATNMIEVANHRRPNPDGLKVGGHQASCASMVTLMTALYLHHLDADDLVAVKPHSSPVLHALNYLMGTLDASQLTALRRFGGLQAYPSRTKDPDRVDFSTGSVGLGPTATIFAATTRDYVNAHFGERPRSRFVAVLGDAELDEGNVWEAVHDPATTALGQVTWLVDFNRQSLDRIVPDVRISPWHAAFAAHGWQAIEVKYGHRLRRFVDDNDGGALLEWIDAMPNERYQSLFGLAPGDLRDRFLAGAPGEVDALLHDLDDQTVAGLVTDLGGHDLASVLDALRQSDADPTRPTVVFAYTHKGWGLPIQGQARNHAAVLTTEQVEQLRDRIGLTADTEWDRFAPDSPEGRLLAERAAHLRRSPRPSGPRPVVPVTTSPHVARPISTQEGFGRILVDLSRDERVRPYLVTTSPDVATSTNLAGWINRTGIFAEHERRTWSDDPMLRWRETPTGQHIELGISEMNMFSLLGQLGSAEAFSGQRLLPVGTLYDPFVCRGLDALIYAAYTGAGFVFAGTPSGVTLAPEGGSHQSTVTASIGTELPGVTYHEPAYVQALDWTLCDALARVAAADGVHPEVGYFRLSTRTIPQQPFADALARIGEASLRSQVLQGAYRLRAADEDDAPRPRVTLAATGAVMPEVLAAADELSDEGVAVDVVDITSPGRLYRAWRRGVEDGIGSARVPDLPGVLRACFPHRAPIVTVQDASSHHLAWLGGALGVCSASLGVDAFGQSGAVADLYAAHRLDAGSVVNAALGVMGL
ncbi:1-deoxy-D-xylulose-5-phosphate synthase N-terminal domain-containing protein [Brooklawnia cerclae]|uniref:Pyruvate dehydrogenase E1 component n=1 Tax=Brooklawnia cerclae TaxID=349934 RepID=A0ABX0SJH0_9ACTN|nr:transketolase C-terminal domain-containing protein [Brooklawnia cerclae]NIH58064.1 pyruvate dehydrogenase E1 component [Brooklawnia cerclae]